MAKALLGYTLAADPRLHGQTAQLVTENRRLRQRIADLESVLTAAQVENEALSALLAREADVVLEPA